MPVTVKTIRLDTYLKESPPPDLMKIDVETHEAEVLEGMREMLRRSSPDFLIEILNDEVGKNVEALLHGHQYLFFNIDEASGIRREVHLGKSDHWNYLICKPATAAFLGLIS